MEPGAAVPGGLGWRRPFRPAPGSALQSCHGPSAGSTCATLKFLLERDLEEEREGLLEDQKICRRQARKHCMETNRRRKALEEKQKKEEEKELRFREQILKQRKLKLQEATEKFQRAHLPVCQRRLDQRKPTPQLEDALEQIQGSVLTSGLNLSSSKRCKSSSRTTDTHFDSSTSKNGFLHREQISTNGGCDKRMQENGRTNLDNDQLLFQQNVEEMQRLLEEHHLSSLANFHQEVNQITSYNSLSSLDSLEAGEQNENYTTSSKIFLTTQGENSIPHNSQKTQFTNKNFLNATKLTFSKNQLVNNWLINLDSQNSQTNIPFHDNLAKQTVLTPAENVHNSKQKSFVPSGTEERTEIYTSDNQIALVNSPCAFIQNKKEEKNNLLKAPSSEMLGKESSVAIDSPVATHDPISRERVLDSIQEQSSELTQQRRTTSVQTSDQPKATPVILPPKQWSLTGAHNSTLSANPLQRNKNTNIVPCTENLDNLSEMKDENIKHFSNVNQGISLFQETSKASISCDTNEEKNNKKQEKGDVAEAISTLSNSEFNPDLSQHHRYLRNNIHERKGVKSPKSILKKESKYANYCFKAVVMNRRISFGNQTASSIRDSLELAKMKGKDAENQKTNKKLRWFDEIDKIMVEDDKSSEKNITGLSQAQLQPSYDKTKFNSRNNNLRSIPACTANSICTENQQDYPLKGQKIVGAEGSERDNIPLHSFVSTGYHFAKQAWMASKGDESNPPSYSGDSKIQKNNLHKGKTKIFRRARSAKVQSGFTPKNRKGTTIRPQSASEVHTIIKAQGKIIVPHPPPKPVSGNRTDQNVVDTVCQAVNASKLQPSITNSNYTNARHVLPADQVSNRNTVENNKSIICSSDVVTVMAPPPSYSVSQSEPLAKTNYSVNNIQTIAQQDSWVTGNKRKPVCAENGLRLDHTPTDEEINLLWQGVNNTLSQKDYALGDFRHCDVHYNNSCSTNLQPTKANISHVTIDGDSLLTSFKSSKMKGFFSSSNGAIPVIKRKEISDNNEKKHRALLKQRRQTVAAAGGRPIYHGQNTAHALQLRPFQCTFEPVQTVSGIPNSDKVSESTAQFLLAENLIDTSVTEGEILAAMETVQPTGHTLVLNAAQRLSMSALSLEEQKILQSLDRLNQRLHNVQEAIAKHPYTSSVLQIISPLNDQQSVSSPVDSPLTMQRYRHMSADTLAQLQRKF